MGKPACILRPHLSRCERGGGWGKGGGSAAPGDGTGKKNNPRVLMGRTGKLPGTGAAYHDRLRRLYSLSGAGPPGAGRPAAFSGASNLHPEF